MTDSPTKEFVILLAAIILGGSVILLAILLGSCHTKVYSTPPAKGMKIVQPIPQAQAKPVAIPPKVAVHKAKKSTTCDPANIGCGVTYYHNGIASKEE